MLLALLASVPLQSFAASADFSCDPEGAFALTSDGQTVTFASPAILVLDEARPAPANWRPTWSELEGWPSGGKPGSSTWSLLPRYDDDGSIILGGAFRQLVPGSVEISSPDGATTYLEGRDYRVNGEWGFVANVADRLGAPGTGKLRFRAKLALQRIDLVQSDANGKLSVKQGASRRVSPMIPDPDENCTARFGVYIAPWKRGGDYRLLAEDVFPIDAEKAAPVAPVRPEAAARTLAKLRAGEPVTIAFVGDSITLGAEAGRWWMDDTTHWRGRTLRGLRERFPKADIKEVQAFQGGRGIAFGLDVLKETVLPAKPDLAFIMIGVNDCHKGLHDLQPRTPPAEFEPAFDALVSQCLDAGIEVVILTTMETNPFDANGDAARWAAYRDAIRRVSDARATGYGDTYEDWQRLRYRGIPPFSQLHNWINHPGAWGHAVFADAALRFFPANEP